MARTFGADQAGRETRTRILDAALELFSERGYAGTSIAAVAKAVGLSAPGVLHHFPDKRTLLLAVLANEGRLFTDEQGPAYEDLTVADAVRLLVLTVQENQESPRSREVIRLEHLCALAPGDGAEMAAEWSRARMDRLRIAIQAMAERTRPGETSAAGTDDTAGLADLIIATLVGLEHLWLLDENFDMVAGMRTFAGLLAKQLDLPNP
ncbi:TetR/AcrR family transcriptional regulator [Nocardia stercoris]|uniref:TetR/AcrR family transcriptional regulator n=1 Tax=Nocardia stercoris TaxID=2483361 RepID=A0A3M2L8E4_9NOCA|nr:TetR/AcrR family transcriptional regulator [Nocardia stercoris]RMI32783.1 TetR/AcrR family transcriptional regulator [Nocardia stercoris]